MPIEAPSHTAIGSRAINSEFVICQNFVFRPANVDGFSYNVKLFMGDETGSPGRLGRVLSDRQGILLFDEIEKAHRLI